MTTKHRFRDKYALQVRERDHNPPHVHLVGCGVDAIIYLENLDCVGLVPAALKRDVLLWIEENREDLQKELNRWHK